MQRRPLKPPCQEDQPIYFTSMSEAVKPPLRLRMLWAKAKKESLKIPPYPSFALIEIFAFSTFDTGQPFSAASAYL
jgi:hypothetical protein